VIALLLTPLCRDLAIKFGMLDQPDNDRKIHQNPIPRVGGLPIVIALLGSFGVLLVLPLRGGDMLRGNLALLWRLSPAAILVCMVGFLDDIFGMKPRHKLLGQIVGALLVFAAGIHFTGVGSLKFPLWLALPATVVWLVGCTNALNLIDGLDGLAAGVGFIATITILIAARLQGNMPLVLATAPLAGALLGFLRYNFNPATVFLGDCGSLLIGFLLGCYGLLWNEKSTTMVGITVPLIAFSIPLLDTSLSIVRRFLRRQPIFGADRGHIHHKLLARGLAPRSAALVIYVACAFGSILSLASVAHEQLAGVIFVTFCTAAWIAVEQLGYTELVTARRMVFTGRFRRRLGAQLKLNTFRDALTAASTPEQCWQVLRNAYTDFGFQRIRLRLSDDSYDHGLTGYAIPNSWTIRIALSDIEYLNLSAGFAEEHSATVVSFADTAAKVLQAKVKGVTLASSPKRSSVLAGPKPLAVATNAVTELV
jgi:UDP-GlcNAc:undecaprenyl-phosphate GlcNAc-1-phosphate transferase